MPSCEKALQQIEDTKKDNEKIKQQYEADKESYARWLKRKNDWESKSGPYEKWKKYDGVNREFWAKETDGTCWWGENWGDANNWCHKKANEKGYDGENYWAKEWGGCDGRWGNFKCKKDDSTVMHQQNAYKNDVPEVDLDTGKYWLNKSEPTVTYLPVPDVKCCQELTFKNIKAADVSFNNTSQTCDIEEKNKDGGKGGKKDGGKKDGGKKDGGKKDGGNKEPETDYSIIIFFIVILCLFVLSLSSLAVSGLLLNKKNN